MALLPRLQNFMWGPNGQPMTPDQVERLRAQSESRLAGAIDTSPVGHWSQGAARLVNALGGVMGERRANRAEQAGLDAAREKIRSNPALSGYFGDSPVVNALAESPASSPAVSPVVSALVGGQPQQPQFAPDGSIVRQGLIERGLPEHIADAFVLNFQDESGLNPGINEKNPIVAGSRGGFGLAQWTGPRRRALEAFAAQRGAPVDDMNTQLDFLMTELQGPEAKAAERIFSAQDTPTAAAAIVNSFLRPAEEHRARREAAYLGGASPSYANSPKAQSPVIPALMEAMTDPWVQKEYGPVIQALMGQEMQRQNAIFDQQLRQQDPYRQAQLEQIQLQNQQLRNPRPEADPAEIAALKWRADQAGLAPGTTEYQEFILNGGRPTSNDGPAAFEALHRQAVAAGFEPGSEEYKNFMATRGSGLAAEARVVGEAAGAAAASAPADYQAAQNALDLIESIRNDPSRRRATGKSSILNAIPGTAGYDFQLKVEQAKGGAFLTAVQTMKGLGALSNNEGQAATAAISRMSTASTEDGFLEALADYEKIVRQGLERAAANGGAPQSNAAAVPTAQPARRRWTPDGGLQ